MKDLLLEIARELVEYPNQVRVNEIESEQTIVIELSVAKKDVGKIIGVKGRNISAIRTVINAASGKLRKRTIVEVLE